MNISYSNTKTFTCEDLFQLFSSLSWVSANYPERLHKAVSNSATVFSAWDGSRLIGLVNAIDDGSLTAYIPYLLVHPQYHNLGIGRQLLNRMKETYKDYLYLVLISEDKKLVPFYSKQGFSTPENTFAMSIEHY